MGFVRQLSFKFECGFCLTNDNHNLVIFNRFFTKFHVSIVSIKLVFKLEYKLSPTNVNQDGQQNGAAYQFAFVDNLP